MPVVTSNKQHSPHDWFYFEPNDSWTDKLQAKHYTCVHMLAKLMFMYTCICTLYMHAHILTRVRSHMQTSTPPSHTSHTHTHTHLSSAVSSSSPAPLPPLIPSGHVPRLHRHGTAESTNQGVTHNFQKISHQLQLNGIPLNNNNNNKQTINKYYYFVTHT